MKNILSGLIAAIASLLLLAGCVAQTPRPPVDITPPNTPAGLTATPGNAQVALSWLANAEPDLASYTLYRRTQGGTPSPIASVPAGTTSFTDATVTNDTTYLYSLDAVDTSGNRSNRSTEVQATPTNGNDTIPPTVVSTDPAGGTTNVPLNTNISVTFSEPMNQAATQAALSFDPNVTCSFSWDPTGTTLTCSPTFDLTAVTQYDVTIGTGARDLAGNPLQAPFTFGFTTGNLVLATCIFDNPNSVFNACVFGN